MSGSSTPASACASTVRFAIATRWSKRIMRVSATEDDGWHRQKRAEARRGWKRGASGMLAARVADVRLRVVRDWGKSTFQQ